MILGLLLQVIVRDLNSFWMITIAILFQELFSPTLDIDISKLLDLLSVHLCRHSYTPWYYILSTKQHTKNLIPAVHLDVWLTKYYLSNYTVFVAVRKTSNHSNRWLRSFFSFFLSFAGSRMFLLLCFMELKRPRSDPFTKISGQMTELQIICVGQAENISASSHEFHIIVILLLFSSGPYSSKFLLHFFLCIMSFRTRVIMVLYSVL